MMNEKKNEDNNEKEKSETQGSTSESGSKGEDEKTDKKPKSNEYKPFCKPLKINISNVDINALYAGVESLFKSASKLDSKVTIYAGNLYSRVKDYFKTSIESYK